MDEMGTAGQPGSGLEQAEIEDVIEAGAPCPRCSGAIGNFYFTMGESIICERCRHGLDETEAQGARLARLSRAGMFGGLAAAVGSATWFAISHFSGYEFGIVAILVGWAVGTAVSIGSGRRGGVGYQMMAVFLTYMAIVASYAPMVVQGFMEAEGEMLTESIDPLVDPEEVAGSTGELTPMAEQSVVGQSDDAGEPVVFTESDFNMEELSNGEQAIAVAAFVVLVLAIAAAAPFLAGAENLMGLFIIGIALYQAWIMNRKVDRGVLGPFEAGKPLEATS